MEVVNFSSSTEVEKMRKCQAVCLLHELTREHVWKIVIRSILYSLAKVVISHVCPTNIDG